MSSIDNLAKDLVKIMHKTDEKGPKPYEPVATVVKEDENNSDILWVKIPGSDSDTPVEKTINANPGDSVRVRVSGGRAWVVGNASNPPTDDTRANQVGAAAQPSIDFVAALADKDVTVKSITAATGYIDDLYSKNIHTENLEATTAYIKDLTAEQIEAGAITTDQLDAKYATIETLEADYATIEELHADYAHIKDGVIDNAKIGYADVQDLHAHYAQLDAANIDTATIQDAWIDNLMVQSGLISHEGTIYELDAIQVNAANITAGTIDVERLVITVDGEKYLFNPKGYFYATEDTEIVHGKVYYTVVATAVADPIDDNLASYYELIDGKYSHTTDLEVQTGKTYYTLVGTAVANPVVSELGSYYEEKTYEKLHGNVIGKRTLTADKIVAGSITTQEITAENLIGTGGWINLRNGTFEYQNATTGDGITWDGQHLSIRGSVEITSNNYYTKNDVDGLIGDIQDQIDGVIDTWYYSGDPKPNKDDMTHTTAPASSWTTDTDRYNHLRDLYFNTDNGHSFRWALEKTLDTAIVSGKRYYTYNSSTGKYTYVTNPVASALSTYYEYKWIQITDADAIKALEDAAKAQDTADGKRRVFVAQPTNAQEYDVGDLWVNATYGTTYSNDILKCKTAKAAGVAFNISHWALASKYTDDSNVYKKSDFSISPEAIIGKVSAIEGWDFGGRNYCADFVHQNGGTTSGVTFTYNDDGSWRVNGTATADINRALYFIVNGFPDLGYGDTYTLSIDSTMPSGARVYVNFANSSSTTAVDTKNGTYGQNTFTFITNESYRIRYVGIAIKNGATVDFTFRMKLEKGNKATDWTPAPEDTDAKISELNTSIEETADAIKLEASRRESSVNLLLDSDAPSLTKVYADYNRYFSSASITAIVPTYIELTDPPEAGIEHCARFVCDGTNTANAVRAYAFYNTDGTGTPQANAIPFVAGQTYTATWWARYTSGTAGNLKTRISYPKGDGSTNTASSTPQNLTNKWKIYSHTFTLDALNTNYNRIWFDAYFVAGKTGTIEICGCKLIAGDSIEEYKTQILQTADNVLIKATKGDTTNSQGGQHLIQSLINVAPEGVQISANKVNITGTTIFNAVNADDSAKAAMLNSEIEVGGRNLVTGTSDEWFTQTIVDGTNKGINLFGLDSVGHGWLDIPNIAGVKAGDLIQVSFDIKFSSDWTATGTGTKHGYVQGSCNGISGTWNTINYGGAGGNQESNLEAIMASSSKEGHINTYFKVTSSMLNGTVTGLCMSNIRFDYYSGTVSIRRVKVEKGNKPTDWTPAPEDSMKQEQRIYYRSNSTTAPSAPTTWVTSTATANATWTTKRMQYNQTYKYLYTCIQRQTEGGGITNTTVLLDDTTTVIDGGNIITGTVLANAIKANSGQFDSALIPNLSADKINTGTINISRIPDGALNSNITVGGGNIIRHSQYMVNFTRGSSATWLNQTGTGTPNYRFVRLTGSSENWDAVVNTGSLPLEYLDGTTEYVLSFEYYSSASALIYPYIGGSSRPPYTDGTSRTKYIGWSSSVTIPSSGSKWKQYSFPSRTIATSQLTSGSGDVNSFYLQFYNRTDGVQFNIRNVKLEKGNKATAWSPAAGDDWSSGVNLLRGTDTMKNTTTYATGGFYTSNSSYGTVTYNYSVSNPPIPRATKGILLTCTSGNAANRIGFAQQGVPMTKGPVTFSVWAKGTAGDVILLQTDWTHNDSGRADTTNYSKLFTIPDSSWHKYEWTRVVDVDYSNPSVTVSGTVYSHNAGYVYFGSATSGRTLTVIAPMLEYGTVASDWTPYTGDVYVTHINETGVRIHPASTEDNSVLINGDGMYIYQGGTDNAHERAYFTATAAAIGTNGGNRSVMNDTGLHVYKLIDGTQTQVGFFGETFSVGRASGATKIVGDANGLFLYDSAGADKLGINTTTVRIGSNSGKHVRINDSGMTVYTGTESNSTNVANFSSTARIGSTDRQRVVINPSGIDMYGYNANASTANQLLCHIGFDSGNATSGTAIAPFYTFGTRLTDYGTGNYSVVEGYNGEASGFGSYAGTYGIAIGVGSFARGLGARANGAYQTVIGRYNELNGSASSFSNSDKAFIIGKGTSTNDRSNAFDVQWNGWVHASGGYTGLYKITTVKKTLSSGIAANSYVSGASITMTAQNGYDAVGIVGWSTTQWRIRPTTHYVSSNTSIFAGFANDSATAVTNSTDVTFYVLWLKATSG